MKPSAFMNGKQATANQPSWLRKIKKAGKYETSYSKAPQTQGNKHLKKLDLRREVQRVRLIFGTFFSSRLFTDSEVVIKVLSRKF